METRKFNNRFETTAHTFKNLFVSKTWDLVIREVSGNHRLVRFLLPYAISERTIDDTSSGWKLPLSTFL